MLLFVNEKMGGTFFCLPAISERKLSKRGLNAIKKGSNEYNKLFFA